MSVTPELLIRAVKLDLVTVDNLGHFWPTAPPRHLVDWPTPLSAQSHLLLTKRHAASGAPAELRQILEVSTGRVLPPPPRRRKRRR